MLFFVYDMRALFQKESVYAVMVRSLFGVGVYAASRDYRDIGTALHVKIIVYEIFDRALCYARRDVDGLSACFVGNVDVDTALISKGIAQLCCSADTVESPGREKTNFT